MAQIRNTHVLLLKNVSIIEWNYVLHWIIHFLMRKSSKVQHCTYVLLCYFLSGFPFDFQDVISVKPRAGSGASDLIKQDNQYHSYGIILNHNRLSGSMDKFPDFVRSILVNPHALAVLDLSFNSFTEIPSVKFFLSFFLFD